MRHRQVTPRPVHLSVMPKALLQRSILTSFLDCTHQDTHPVYEESVQIHPTPSFGSILLILFQDLIDLASVPEKDRLDRSLSNSANQTEPSVSAYFQEKVFLVLVKFCWGFFFTLVVIDIYKLFSRGSEPSRVPVSYASGTLPMYRFSPS